jgi:hypothetical protein
MASENKDELNWSNVDTGNPEEMEALIQLEVKRAGERIKRVAEHLRKIGVIDADGNRINQDTPVDMVENSQRDFGG